MVSDQKAELAECEKEDAYLAIGLRILKDRLKLDAVAPGRCTLPAGASDTGSLLYPR